MNNENLEHPLLYLCLDNTKGGGYGYYGHANGVCHAERTLSEKQELQEGDRLKWAYCSIIGADFIVGLDYKDWYNSLGAK